MNETSRQVPTLEYTKLTMSLYTPVYELFDRQLAAALLRRDAFLDRVIAIEVPNVRRDLQGLRNSSAARREIAGKLKQLGGNRAAPLTTVSMTFRKTTAEALRDLVAEHNLCRDGLINWIIMLLQSRAALLDTLELPKRIAGSWSEGLEGVPTSPLAMIESTLSDPLFYLREACQAKHGCGLYSLPLPTSLHAFQTYLPDEWVPKTNAGRQREARAAEMLASLELFERGMQAEVLKSGGAHE